MLFDSLLFYIATYGFVLVFLFILLKFAVLLWYKNGDLKFAFTNFLYLTPRLFISSKNRNKEKWPVFVKRYRMISILKYTSLVIWILLFLAIKVILSK